MLGDLIRPKGSAAHHLGDERMVLCKLEQFAVSVQVRTAVAYVDHTELRPQMKAMVTVVPIPRNSGCSAASSRISSLIALQYISDAGGLPSSIAEQVTCAPALLR
jgi:hypothetical protein